jgi:phenylacetaldehyde dehydrogenase
VQSRLLAAPSSVVLWSKLTPDERGRLIWKLADLLEAHAEEFAQLESLDNGKPISGAREDDVPDAIKMFRYMAGWATKLESETISLTGSKNYFAYTFLPLRWWVRQHRRCG